MRIMKSLLLLTAFVIIGYAASAQSKPIRIGVKAGLSNLASLNFEYVTPLANEKIAFSGDFSTFSLNIQDVDTDFTYWEIGAHYYLLRNGRNVYVGLSYNSFDSDLTFSDLDSNQGNGSGGEGTTSYDFTAVNLKVGGKFGGTFYFRPEIGYAISGGGDDSVQIDTTFPNGSQEIITEDLPGALTGGLLFNIGFGFAF